jgi:glycosyltransferase involved in cell wall biosynthesis
VIETVAIIPAFNESATIRQVVTGAMPLVRAVIVVDDGSADDTADVARSAGAQVIRHETNRGKGAAVRSGLEHALHIGCSHVLLMDGDLQHLPSEASVLLDEADRSGVDLVVGERAFDRAAMPLSRYVANRVGSRVLSSFIGMPLGDTQSGFRVFRGDLLRRMPLRSTGYEIETEMLVKAGRLGARISRIPVSAVYGTGVSKLRPIRDTTRTCFLAVYYRFLERS